jgi:hypothetical protein
MLLKSLTRPLLNSIPRRSAPTAAAAVTVASATSGLSRRRSLATQSSSGLDFEHAATKTQERKAERAQSSPVQSHSVEE